MPEKKINTSSAVRSEENKVIDFEEALAEVEGIVAQLESGRAGLGESLQLYEAGVRQIKNCHAMLHQAQRRISLLSGFDADGNPITEPLDQDGEALQEPTEQSTRRRKPISSGSASGKRSTVESGREVSSRGRQRRAPQSQDNGGDFATGRTDESESTVDDSGGLF